MRLTSTVAAVLLGTLVEYCQANLSARSVDPCCDALLCSKIGDRVVLPHAKSYKESVDSYWAVNVQLEPNCIVQPVSTDEVSTAVQILANSITSECKFAVRSGGHTTWPGANNIEDGVTIDLSNLNSTTYHKGAETASIHPGARWGDVYKALEPFGVTVPGGRTAPVGVGGFLLGGGNTFHTARVGFATDNVENFEVVLASGGVVNASRQTNTDLFKALKGGTGNFGIVTKYDLKIIPQDKLWGGLVAHENSTTPQLVDAFVNFVDHLHEDPYASYIGMWQYSTATKQNTVASALEYTKAEPHPPAFHDFYQVKNVSDTMRLATMANLTAEIGQPDGYRDVFLTGTYANDAKVLARAVKIHDSKIDVLKSQAKSKDWTIYAMFQPWPKIFWEQSVKKGSNVLGLEQNDENLFQVLYDYSWSGAADDKLFRQTGIDALKELNEYAKSEGKFNEYVYLNYADRTQNPLRGYGQENLEYIKKVAETYDPDGVFQTQVPGGFKITQA
ncbi:FAD-binding oxidoreductase [Aspergillus candidus]|uniref:FAD-binding domain-containing protein n=1 Tax=Aspergillus candidus TaxID=41067 RepID=A0A2I2FIE3_ASPCN|nr:FAD-binding domain-containing protein [Aspergillus candidus]PLB40384.1 FAD-binding domain-containing protein [Aspergillus candidus]